MVGKSSKIVGVGAVALFTLFGGAGFVVAETSGPHAGTSSVTLELTNFDVGNGLSFPKFDTSLGQLQSVTLSLSGSMSTTLTFVNNTQNAAYLTGVTSLRLVVQDEGNTLTQLGGIPVTPLPWNDPVNLPPSAQLKMSAGIDDVYVSAGQTRVMGPYTASQSSIETYTDSDILSSFQTGAGPVFLDMAARALTSFTAPAGNFTLTQRTYASVSGNVTYQYSAVPEATTLLLGLAGGMPLLMHRRRARAAKA